MKTIRLWPLLATALFLTGCSSASKLLEGVTGEKDVVLPGKRESVLSPGDSTTAPSEASSEPIVIPTAETNSSWAQPGGQATNSFGNLSAGATLSRAWAASAGEGTSSEGRIVASPIIVGGNAYVLDSRSNVTAIRTSGGGQAWRVSLVPEGKSTRAFGGGLASDGQRIYATSVFGEALALDASTGAVLWRKKLGAPVRAAPTVSDGTIYFTGSSNEVFALRASDGGELWKYQGTGGQATIASSPSPAVAQGFVVIPTTAGEIIAFTATDGLEAWSDAFTSSDPAASATNIGSVAGRPVTEGNQVIELRKTTAVAKIYEVELLDEAAAASQSAAATGAKVISAEGNRLLIEVAGGKTEAAAVLRELMSAGIEVAGFRQQSSTLEERYQKAFGGKRR